MLAEEPNPSCLQSLREPHRRLIANYSSYTNLNVKKPCRLIIGTSTAKFIVPSGSQLKPQTRSK